MMACTWPFGTSRLTPFRISLSSSASLTHRFLISSIAHVVSMSAGARASPRASALVGARAQLDLGWIKHAHPIAFTLGGLAVLVELDEEGLAGAERLHDSPHVAGTQGEAGARLRQGIAPFALPLVHLPPQLRRRHRRHEIRRITHVSTPFALVVYSATLCPGWLPVCPAFPQPLHLLSPASAPLSIGLRPRQPNKTDGQSCNPEPANRNLRETCVSSGLWLQSQEKKRSCQQNGQE